MLWWGCSSLFGPTAYSPLSTAHCPLPTAHCSHFPLMPTCKELSASRSQAWTSLFFRSLLHSSLARPSSSVTQHSSPSILSDWGFPEKHNPLACLCLLKSFGLKLIFTQGHFHRQPCLCTLHRIVCRSAGCWTWNLDLDVNLNLNLDVILGPGP